MRRSTFRAKRLIHPIGKPDRDHAGTAGLESAMREKDRDSLCVVKNTKKFLTVRATIGDEMVKP